MHCLISTLSAILHQLMRILTHYVLREFLVPFFYCLSGFVGIYVLFELFTSFSSMADAKTPWTTIVHYFIAYLSPYFQFLLPGALLLAALYTMWNFCRYSEVTAMRASGIGFIVIVRPLLVVAIVATVIVALINEFYAPWASEEARALRENDFLPVIKGERENVAYYNQRSSRVWRVNKMNLDNPRILEGVRISFDRKDGSRVLEITARKAEYLDGVWWLYHPQLQYFDEFNMPMVNPKPELSSMTLLSFPEFNETPRDFLMMNKAYEFYTTRDMVHDLRNHPNLNPREKASRMYDLMNRFSSPFACIIITLFAIPAGVATGRQSVFKGVVFAIAMFFAYYGMVIGGMMLAKNLLFPVWLAAILPGLTFAGIGAYLFYHQR